MIAEKIDLILNKVGSLEEGVRKLEAGQRKNGLLLEQVQSDVKAVAEGHVTIRTEMSQMEGRLSEKIGQNKSAIAWVAKDLGAKIDRVDYKLEQHVKIPHAV